MRSIVRIASTVMVCLGIVAAAWGQRMAQPPPMMGEFHPVVGTGAQYEVNIKGEKSVWTYSVVGKESVQGQDAYWLEMRMEGGTANGMVMKQLLVTSAGKPEIKRMIMQTPGQAPMEMPMTMMSMMKGKNKETSEGMGEKVGTEPVIVPAGTHLCAHYRKSGPKASEHWISSSVPPYGLVKMTSGDVSMVLVKTLTNESSHIDGEPQKMPCMGGMMPKGEWSDEK